MKRTVLAAMLLTVSAQAAAETRELAVPSDKTWQHVWTSARMPPELSGFMRSSVADFGTQETDIIGTYKDEESGTTVSLYIFRPGDVNVSLWQDRVLTAVNYNANLGKFDAAGRLARSFTPGQGGGADSGYRFVAAVSGKSYVSSGSAMFPHDGWLVGVRMSSQTLDPAALDQRLGSFVAAIPMPQATISYPSAGPVADCADKFSFKKDAKRAQADMVGTLMMGALLSAALKEEQEAPVTEVKPVDLCRDSEDGSNYGVYRIDGSRDAYILALGDAGISVSVAASDLPSLLGGSGGTQYWATMTDTNQSLLYAPFKKLPSPKQVFDTVQRENPVTSVNLDAKGETTINLPSP